MTPISVYLCDPRSLSISAAQNQVARRDKLSPPPPVPAFTSAKSSGCSEDCEMPPGFCTQVRGTQQRCIQLATGGKPSEE